MSLLFLAGGMAWGGTAAEEVQRRHVADTTPEMVVACAPVESLGTLLALLPPNVLAKGGDRVGGRLLQRLADPTAADLAGVSPSGALTLEMWQGTKGLARVHLGFDGTRGDAERFLEELTGEPVAASTAGWRVYDRSTPVDVTWAPGELVLSPAADLPTPVAGGPIPMLDGLPTQPGCVLYGVPPARGEVKFEGLAAYVPTAGGAPVLVRVDVPKMPPGLLQGANSPPIGGSSTERPTGLMSLGVAPAELLRALADSGEVGDKLEFLDQLQELERRMRIGGGLTVAFYGNPKGGEFVAVVPATAGDGQRLPPRKVAKVVAKVLSEEGQEAEITGKGRVRGIVADKMLFVAAEPGRIVLGTRPVAVEEAATGQGTPWLTPEFEALASSWAVAVRAASEPDGPQIAMEMGFRGRPTGFELSMAVTGADAKNLGPMMAPILGLASSNFGLMQQKAKRAEVPTNVDGIKVALLAYDAAFDSFVAAPAAPRALDQLTKEAVPWVSNPGFTQLGWAPDGDVRGVYWVEVNADGSDFVVYGAIDADGDGEPVIYRATRTENATLWKGGEGEY